MSEKVTCPKCDGSGKYGYGKCSQCQGFKTVDEPGRVRPIVCYCILAYCFIVNLGLVWWHWQGGERTEPQWWHMECWHLGVAAVSALILHGHL